MSHKQIAVAVIFLGAGFMCAGVYLAMVPDVQQPAPQTTHYYLSNTTYSNNSSSLVNQGPKDTEAVDSTVSELTTERSGGTNAPGDSGSTGGPKSCGRRETRTWLQPRRTGSGG